jgi:hypothetical protein
MTLKLNQRAGANLAASVEQQSSLGKRHEQRRDDQHLDLNQVDDKKLSREALARAAANPVRNKMAEEQRLTCLEQSLREINDRLSGANERVDDSKKEVARVEGELKRRGTAADALEKLDNKTQEVNRRLNLAYEQVESLRIELRDAKQYAERMEAIQSTHKKALASFDHAELNRLRREAKLVEEASEGLKDAADFPGLRR